MYNKVFLVGNLTRDPELRYTPSGIPVARFTIAVNRRRKKTNNLSSDETKNREFEAGNNQDVDFIPIVAWRRLAEICGEYLKKGRPVAIEGKLQVRTFETKNGEKRTIAEVITDNMQMLGRKPEGREFLGSEPTEEKNLSEDIPF